MVRHVVLNSAPQLRLLGPMELQVGDTSVELPRSKKCRALLAYLAMEGRSHRREQLCDLLWDVADDPRGALRWTLSRVRSVFPSGADVLYSDRTSVQLPTGRLWIDAAELGGQCGDLAQLSTPQLEASAALYRGEFLQGLELADFLEFSAWSVAHREALRRNHCDILRILTERHRQAPTAALPWARQLVHFDAFDVQAHAALLDLLLAAGFRQEAEQRYAHAQRQFRQVAAPDADALARAWAALRLKPSAVSPSTSPAADIQAAGAASDLPPAASEEASAPAATAAVAAIRTEEQAMSATQAPFVGRGEVVQQVRASLEACQTQRQRRATLFTAEPGGGKTRLLERLRSVAEELGLPVLSARAYDLGRGRPFGPWIDALGVDPEELVETARAGGRARVFERLGAQLERGAAGAGCAVLLLDDVQWLDRDSAEVLRHLLSSLGNGLVALLAARTGELPDNPGVSEVLRSLRRAGVLREHALPALEARDIQALVGAEGVTDLERLMRACAGNPLYALELTRGTRAGDLGATPTLVELVRERVLALSDSGIDVLRWAAVLGYAFDAAGLEALSELSQMALVDALEELERHNLLRIDATRTHDRYTFSHDVVREAVYGELSHPRRRLMHRKVARLLRGGDPDPATAHEVARHASLAGEIKLGVEACTAAAQYALRSCANADAEALARRGLHHAQALDERERVAATLDLLHVQYSARAPDRSEATERVRGLAERALDLGLTHAARIGFQMLSYIRWESSSMADAHENILQAERVSRSADPEERSQALAHAARCLVLLERNLSQAEAFVMEASGVAQRNGSSSAAVAFALAMLAAHRGEHREADAAFREAQGLARADGERLAELGALQHRLMLLLDAPHALDTAGGSPAESAAQAGELADELCALAARVRPGAEVAIAAALRALYRERAGAAAAGELGARVDALRTADAKYELAFVLTRWAMDALAAGRNADAERIGAEAFEVSVAIGRISEQVIAQTVRAQVAQRAGEPERCEALLAQVKHARAADLSAVARARLAAGDWDR